MQLPIALGYTDLVQYVRPGWWLSTVVNSRYLGAYGHIVYAPCHIVIGTQTPQFADPRILDGVIEY